MYPLFLYCEGPVTVFALWNIHLVYTFSSVDIVEGYHFPWYKLLYWRDWGPKIQVKLLCLVQGPRGQFFSRSSLKPCVMSAPALNILHCVRFAQVYSKLLLLLQNPSQIRDPYSFHYKELQPRCCVDQRVPWYSSFIRSRRPVKCQTNFSHNE